MLIKQPDDHSAELAQLGRLAKSSAGYAAKHAAQELVVRKAGLKGEAESAYQIDFHFAASPNWAVIHDLRLEHNGRTAQIDHLLINRWMECYVLESKHFHAGIKITEDGEFMRWNDYKHTYEGMPSPLLQKRAAYCRAARRDEYAGVAHAARSAHHLCIPDNRAGFALGEN